MSTKHTPEIFLVTFNPDGDSLGLKNIVTKDGAILAERVSEHNADLFAAAPDMLAACKAALARFEWMTGQIFGKGAKPKGEWIDLLQAAIAKAEGKKIITKAEGK